MNRGILEKFYNLYKDGRKEKAPVYYVDFFKARHFLFKALQQKDQELIEKIVNYDEQYISEDVRKAINRMKDKLTDLIKNQ